MSPDKTTNQIIGTNLKLFRSGRSVTLAQLAAKSGVAERTIQRAEAGEAIRPENLKALLDTLGMSLEAAQIDYENPPEHIQKRLRDVAALEVVKASRILTALEVDGLSNGLGLSIMHRDERLSGEALDLVVQIQEGLQDMGDGLLDGDHAMRWEESKRIAEMLEALDEAGGALLVGYDTVHMVATKFAPQESPFKVLIALYCPKEAMPPNLAYDRRSLPAFIKESRLAS